MRKKMGCYMLFSPLEVFTVSFFGHRYVDNFSMAERKIDTLIRKLLQEKEYVEFLVGRDGDFDQLVSSAIRRAKRDIGDRNCAHVWVLPYPTAEFRDNEESFYEYYDEIEIASNTTGNIHPKGAFQARNRMMVDRSELVVVYIDHESGGAWQTYKYAQKNDKSIINLAEETEEL